MTDRAQSMAMRHERDRRRLERMGVRAAASLGRRARIVAIRAYRSGDDPALAFRRALDQGRETLIDAMIAGHLRGRYRTFLTASQHQRRQIKLAGTAYDDAITWLLVRMALPEDTALQLRLTYTNEAERLTREASNFVERKVNNALLEVTRQGLHKRAAEAALRKAFDAAGVTPQNSYTLENLYRTQTQLAYAAGRWNALQDPEVDEIVWGYEYVTVGDDRVRSAHVAMNGVKLPKDDPWWLENWPPNGFSCRCTTIEVFDTDSHRQTKPRPKTVDGAKVEPAADEGFRFHPGRTFRDVIQP